MNSNILLLHTTIILSERLRIGWDCYVKIVSNKKVVGYTVGAQPWEPQ
jgi:hypothetical protein